ncbi:Mobile element protein [Microcystis panniformis FACHB-1757]|uniref:Mobile element protein n=1 Tax=Microcystis panniformis FACHB-1757 TaxID=1638788 RepID=A0A0K1S991_9CHRO|nr:Mobile element protein [Microcystis panniformis FACHB-1757]
MRIYSKNIKGNKLRKEDFLFSKTPAFLPTVSFSNLPIESRSWPCSRCSCLLVYTIGQRQLRLNLKQQETGLKNQLGKLTDRPTLRWIFQNFQGIHLLRIQDNQKISNLTDERRNILRFFPKPCQEYYLLS